MMAVQDVMKPGIGPRRACKILTVDPLNRQIEAMLKDATTVQVAVFDTPGLFIWPKVGEYWTIHRREGFWMLDHRVESYDDEQKIADLNPGEGRIDADIIKTISGKDLIAINTPKDTTEDISLVYSNGEWVTKSLSESLIGESEINKSVMILDSSGVKADEDSLITYKNTSWVPTHDIKVHSLEVDGKSFIDNSLIYGAGTISVNTDGVVTGSNTTFNKDMANGKMTIGTTSYQIIDFYSATSLKIDRSGTAIPGNTQYSITYYPKTSTTVKIGNNASITVGNNSDFLIKNSDSYYVKITSDGNIAATGDITAGDDIIANDNILAINTLQAGPLTTNTTRPRIVLDGDNAIGTIRSTDSDVGDAIILNSQNFMAQVPNNETISFLSLRKPNTNADTPLVSINEDVARISVRRTTYGTGNGLADAAYGYIEVMNSQNAPTYDESRSISSTNPRHTDKYVRITGRTGGIGMTGGLNVGEGGAVEDGRIYIRNNSAIYSGGDDNPNTVETLDNSPTGSLFLSATAGGRLFHKIRGNNANTPKDSWVKIANDDDIAVDASYDNKTSYQGWRITDPGNSKQGTIVYRDFEVALTSHPSGDIKEWPLTVPVNAAAPSYWFANYFGSTKSDTRTNVVDCGVYRVDNDTVILWIRHNAGSDKNIVGVLKVWGMQVY